MGTDLGPAKLGERLVVYVAGALRRLGMEKLVSSPLLRLTAKRFFFRQTNYPCTRRIASGLARGLQLQILKETPQSYWMGVHEPHVQEVLRQQIRPGMTIYDCGANIGYLSVMFANLTGCKGRVFAFEPSPESFACLQEAQRLNNFEHLIPVAKAVWNRRERLRFIQEYGASAVSDRVAGCLDKNIKTQAALEVDAISLDEFVYEQGNPVPDFIKIDVEGSEGKAMAGARRILAERRPVLLLEIHGEPGRHVWSVLQELNYEATNIATGEVAHNVREFAAWIRQYLAKPLDSKDT